MLTMNSFATPTGIQRIPCRPGASTDHDPPAEIRTWLGQVVKQPKYLKDYELQTSMNC